MQKSYALFDFDGTLEKGDSMVRLLGFALRRGDCTRRQALAACWAAAGYGLRLRSAVQSKEKALAFMVGWTEAQMSAFARAFCREELAPRLRPEGLKELHRHKREGREILLITASPAFYLEPLRARLGLSALIGTRVAFDEAGRFTGRLGENCRGVAKPLRLAEYLAAQGDRLDYDHSSAYGDSAGDWPMLQLCADPVAVNPKRRLLRKLREAGVGRVARWAEPVRR